MKKLILAAIIIAAFSLALGACDAIEDKINSATAQTETFDLDITDDWVPMYAIEQGGYKLTAVCYAEAMTIDAVLSATDYADMWDDAKGHVDSIEVNSLTYRINHNQSAEGGSLDIFLLDHVPSPIVPPEGVDIDLDDLEFVLVDPDALSNDDRIARIDIPAGADVDDWTDAEFLSGGESKLEDQLLNFNDPFAFCMRLGIPTHGVLDSVEPDLELKMATSFEVTFTPL